MSAAREGAPSVLALESKGMDPLRHLAEELLAHGTLPSRNRAFSQYSDAMFAKAARIVRQIRGVRRELAHKEPGTDDIELRLVVEDGVEVRLVTYRVDLPQGVVTRTARFSDWEWELLCRDGRTAAILEGARAA